MNLRVDIKTGEHLRATHRRPQSAEFVDQAAFDGVRSSPYPAARDDADVLDRHLPRLGHPSHEVVVEQIRFGLDHLVLLCGER